MLRIFCFFNADIFVANTNNENLTYDFNSNINRLVRTNSSGGNMADFTYYYSGNKLSSINGGTAYTYDLNGNTTTDGLRGVSIAYNILNLPKKVSKGKDNIDYIYSAAGEKLGKRKKDGTYQYYAGNMVYSTLTENKIDKYPLKYLLFDEGLVNKTSSVFSYEYHLKDHLGNTRVTFQPNGSTTTTTQVAEYYPFGSSYLPISPAGTNKYLYNGKEKQDDVLGGTALDWYDYGARFYDPMIGRWITLDPLANKYYSISPYVYVANNPLKFVDPDGKKIVDANGNIMYTQSGGWTRWATTDAQRVGTAMMQTRKGVEGWNNLANSPVKTQLAVSQENVKLNGTYVLGKMEPLNGTIIEATGKVKLLEAKITVFEGSINAMMAETNNKSGNPIVDAYHNDTRDNNQRIAAVAGHEIIHLTPENVQQSADNDRKDAENPVDSKPKEVEKQILDETGWKNLKPLKPKTIDHVTQ